MSYLIEKLEDREREIYGRIVEGLRRSDRKFTVAGCGEQALLKLWDLVEGNEPELFYVDFKDVDCTFSAKSVTVRPRYLYAKTESDAMLKKLEQKREKVLGEYGGDSAAQAAEYVHDWLAENVRYDYAAVQTQGVPEATTVIGALLKEYAVCEGIAKAVRYLLKPLGVESLVVSGQADVPEGNTGMDGSGHCWNLNRIEGRFYHMDVTWDLKEVTPLNTVMHTFCNVDDGTIIINHDWDFVKYPKASDMAQNYYMRRGCYIRSRQAFERYMEQCLARGESRISVKLDATAGFPDDGGDCIVNMVMKALEKLGIEKTISYVYDGENTMFTVVLNG